jgi:hypothetical protein
MIMERIWTIRRSWKVEMAKSLQSVPENGMFHNMWNVKESGTGRLDNGPPSISQLLKDLYASIRHHLPDSWTLDLATEVVRGTRRLDGLLRLSAPDGTQINMAVEAKRQIAPVDVPAVIAKLRQTTLPEERPLVAAPFIGPRAQELLTAANVGYWDATGNLRIRSDNPVLFIEDRGATANPWTESRQLHSLRGHTAGRAVRALCDFFPPYGIRELAERSVTPASSIARVVGLLEREALVTRGSSGEVTRVDVPRVIHQWTQDYSLTKSNRAQTFLESRGLDALLDKLRQSATPYAVTGSLAGVLVAPIAPLRLAIVYVKDIEVAAQQFGVRNAERGANVLLAEPFDFVVFDRTLEREGVTYAALTQVAADLLTGPGRGPQEGEELLRWMGDNEDAWRTR